MFFNLPGLKLIFLSLKKLANRKPFFDASGCHGHRKVESDQTATSF